MMLQTPRKIQNMILRVRTKPFRPSTTIIWFLSLVMFIQLICSSCSNSAHSVERTLLECLSDGFEKEGVDLHSEISALESHLIDDGVLESNSGESYRELFVSIAEIGDIPSVMASGSFEGLYGVNPEVYYSGDCTGMIAKLDAAEIRNSKPHGLRIAFESVDSSTTANVAKAIISVLDASDFENPYYRSLALLTILNLGRSERGILREMPHKQESQNEFEGFESLRITLTAEGEILVDSSDVISKELKALVKNFILRQESNGVIQFQPEAGTSYDLYIETENQVKGIYHQIREDKARQVYKKPFESLNDEQKIQIMDQYPLNIQSVE